MLLKSIRSQMSYIMRKRLTILTWYIVCGFVIANLIRVIIINKNHVFVSQMYDMVKMLTLSGWSKPGFFFMVYYPLLVVLPTATLLLDDKNSQMQLYLVGRMNRKNYYIGKAVAVFLSTFAIFTLPFLMELLVGLACFHISSFGDPSNVPYHKYVSEMKSSILWLEMYMKNKIVYAAVMTVIFGLVSGILAVFNFALTTFRIFKHKIVTMVSVWLLLILFGLIGRRLDLGYTTEYRSIMRLFAASPDRLNLGVYGSVLLLLLVISGAILAYKIKKDDFV